MKGVIEEREDLFATPGPDRSGKEYWIWKIGWMLVGLFAVLSLGSATIFLTPSIFKLVNHNREIVDELVEAKGLLAETQSESEQANEIAVTSVDRQECRNRYELSLTNARIENTVAQNKFIVSLASAFHGQVIDEVKADLEASNTLLEQRLSERNQYEAQGSPLPCPFEETVD